MREMLEVGTGMSTLLGGLLDASRLCESDWFDGALILYPKSSESAFVVEDLTWKTPA
jgi:hypothetical protein